MSDKTIVVYCACPNTQSANNIAQSIISTGAAACVNIIANITSVFVWENAVQTESEHLLIIKTLSANFKTLEAEILALHPYKVPEIIALPIIDGNANYLAWMHNQATLK